MTTPKLGPIVRTTGAAGGIAYTVTVVYPPANGGGSVRVTFIGSTYGTPGPVLMQLGDGSGGFVSHAEDYGDKLSPGWIRRFYGVAE